MASTDKKVLIIGPGFIGWNVLELLAKEGYAVTGFVRRQEAADQLKASGAAQTVLGELDDKALITKLVADHDIVMHIASADHAPSAEAVLAGVRQRADAGLQTIYIHTTGTSVIGQPGAPDKARVFHDSVQAEIDSVSDTAPHRQIDLAVTAAQKQLLQARKAKIALMIPPLIYGFNPAHQRLSIQIPSLTRYALKHGFAAHYGTGDAVWSVVHVLDLARAYVVLLHHLEAEPYGSADLDNPYYFCEASSPPDGQGDVSWREIAATIGQALHERGAGLVADPNPRTAPPETLGDIFGDFTGAVVGRNSRSRAERLRKLGWKPVEKGWKESFREDELPAILKERTDWSTYEGYAAPVAS
ncbi:hypothetical protein SLS62_009039 [Diatrype stigma]|uniref:NAD-dependent epimerase/dehydratase domain-containing protein n=1 Tax=Diatrype stigma TaxID=117547 RepID=A0AAN9UHM1_9PEZI